MLTTIIVNYKSESKTIHFVLEELSKCKIPKIIVIVNNKATEISNACLASELRAKIVYSSNLSKLDNKKKYSCFIISSEENLGFARGNNLGVEFATKHFDVSYVLFSNNDIRLLSENIIEKLIEKYDNDKNIGMIGPKIVGPHGELQNPYIFLPFWEEMFLRRLRRMFRLKPHQKYNFVREEAKEGFYYRLMGSFFLMSHVDFLACGKMDDNTFLYGEELILTEKLKAINKGCYYLPSVQILHEHNETIGKFLDSSTASAHMSSSLYYYFSKYHNIKKFDIYCAILLNGILDRLSKIRRFIQQMT